MHHRMIIEAEVIIDLVEANGTTGDVAGDVEVVRAREETRSVVVVGVVVT